jgi:hypothetical protein
LEEEEEVEEVAEEAILHTRMLELALREEREEEELVLG